MMSSLIRCCFSLVSLMVATLWLPWTAQSAEPPASSPEGIKFFETKIRPLLIQHCVDCHGPDLQESELRLDTFHGMTAGGTSGPAVVSRKTEDSLLLAAIRYENEHLQMPPDEKLAETDIRLLQEWIEMGAPHPDGGATPGKQPRRGKIDLEEARKHWAFQPITRPELPATTQKVEHPVDAFVQAKWKKAGLSPQPLADKRTLIRRATFDLTGLPPTPEEVDAFLADNSPEAFSTVVDRLLASPQYGERWGRHWLDVVRYADSNGQDENQGFVDAWRYRNYVIAAFNEDMPFDRFIKEQVAGDLLHRNRTQDNAATDFDPIVATGFLTLGPKVLAEKDIVKMEMDIIDEQIDTLGQAFLGMTLACARCHDHKFDPISTADYYALAGIFKSTKTMQSFATIAKYNEQILETEAQQEHRKHVEETRKALQAELDASVKTATEELKKKEPDLPQGLSPAEMEQRFAPETQQALAELRAKISALDGELPPQPTAMAVQEGEPQDLKIHVRGSHLMLGREVPRGVPEVLTPDGPLDIEATHSGRIELAEWLTSPDNPLTARVLANRLWQWHFGAGLVTTPNNFGELGESPSHPQLLDWLASELRDKNWSIKSLHRTIMLSRTYQLSSAGNPTSEAIDPENRLLWRANIQRLDAESLRDSLLAISGMLDESQGESPLTIDKWVLVFNHESKDETSYDSLRRSVYLPVIRNHLYDGFSLFDYTNADVAMGSRAASTVAPQALYAMNSDLFLTAADELAERLFQSAPEDEKTRVQRLYELTLARPASAAETDRILATVKRLEDLLAAEEASSDASRAAWSAICQSVLASNEFTFCE